MLIEVEQTREERLEEWKKLYRERGLPEEQAENAMEMQDEFDGRLFADFKAMDKALKEMKP